MTESTAEERIREIVRDLDPITVNGRLIYGQDDPANLGLEFLPTIRSIWERVYNIAENSDGTYWVSSFNCGYASVPIERIRVREVSGK